MKILASVFLVVLTAGCGSVSRDTVSDDVDAAVEPVPECVLSSDCAGGTPVCDATDEVCRACADNGECAGSADGAFCSPGGGCAECLINTDCTDPSALYCDADTLSCRGCIDHDECASGVCERKTGLCRTLNQVIYVDDENGNDTGSCPVDAPCKSITFGISRVAGERNSVLVAPGAYVEEPTLPNVGPVRLIAYGATVEPPISPDTARNALVQVYTPDGIIEGLTVKNADDAAIHCGGGGGSNSRMILRDITVDGGSQALTNNLACNVEVLGAMISGTSSQVMSWNGGSVIIRRSRIVDNPGSGVIISSAVVDIQNTLFARNGNIDYNRILSLTDDTSSAIIRYNTFVANRPGFVGVIEVSHNNILFNGNIVWDNETGGNGNDAFFVFGGYVSQNIIQRGPEEDVIPGNLHVNPRFANPVAGNYSLLDDSPALDQGSIAGAPTVDIEGTARPIGLGFDLGAFESH